MRREGFGQEIDRAPGAAADIEDLGARAKPIHETFRHRQDHIGKVGLVERRRCLACRA